MKEKKSTEEDLFALSSNWGGRKPFGKMAEVETHSVRKVKNCEERKTKYSGDFPASLENPDYFDKNFNRTKRKSEAPASA